MVSSTRNSDSQGPLFYTFSGAGLAQTTLSRQLGISNQVWSKLFLPLILGLTRFIAPLCWFACLLTATLCFNAYCAVACGDWIGTWWSNSCMFCYLTVHQLRTPGLDDRNSDSSKLSVRDHRCNIYLARWPENETNKGGRRAFAEGSGNGTRPRHVLRLSRYRNNCQTPQEIIETPSKQTQTSCIQRHRQKHGR